MIDEDHGIGFTVEELITMKRSHEETIATRIRGDRATQTATPSIFGDLNPRDLGVQQSLVLDRGSRGERDALTPYFHRDHDTALWIEMERNKAEGASKLILVAGSSTTGKTRALFEATHSLLQEWNVHRPDDSCTLLETLQSPLQENVIIWLDEAQVFFSDERRSEIATALIRVLSNSRNLMVLGTIWRVPYLNELMARGRLPDINAQIRRLLESRYTTIIGVPSSFTSNEMDSIEALAKSDTRISMALKAGRSYGQIIQHLTGGPELISRINDGSSFRPHEKALIYAAIDAKRIGYGKSLSREFLAKAADGYMSPRERPGEDDWAVSSLRDLSRGYREDSSRTDVRNTLSAINSHRMRSGSSRELYVPSDFIVQHYLGVRSSQLGPAELWEALCEHSRDPSDLGQVAEFAWIRGLYRYSAMLHARSAAQGSYNNPGLLGAMKFCDPTDISRAADWVVAHIDMSDLRSVGNFLEEAREYNQDDVIQKLLARLPRTGLTQAKLSDIGAIIRELSRPEMFSTHGRQFAVDSLQHVQIDSLLHAGVLLSYLREPDRLDLADLIASRIAKEAIVDSPVGVGAVLVGMKSLALSAPLEAFVKRLIAESNILDVESVYGFLDWCEYVDDRDSATKFLERGVVELLPIADPRALLEICKILLRLEREDDAQRLTDRVHEAVDVSDPISVADAIVFMDSVRTYGLKEHLIDEEVLVNVPLGATHAATYFLSTLSQRGDHALLSRIQSRRPLQNIELGDGADVANLMNVLQNLNFYAEIEYILGLLPEVSAIYRTPLDVAMMLETLRSLEAADAIQRLLDQAHEASIKIDAWEKAHQVFLLEEFRASGATKSVDRFLRRCANEGWYELALQEQPALVKTFPYGREPDEAPSPRWGWADVCPPE
ncbi:hypothetical protein [Nonomuraea sp. NPDC049028]|uniref:hypothetical protein n=1 Tax=Nonomuraea sp. NPDC049028 TaxID=3364348 RepID=UPI0037110456